MSGKTQPSLGKPARTSSLGENIFIQAHDWEELKTNVQEAVRAFYFDSTSLASIRLRMVRDEVLAVA